MFNHLINFVLRIAERRPRPSTGAADPLACAVETGARSVAPMPAPSDPERTFEPGIVPGLGNRAMRDPPDEPIAGHEPREAGDEPDAKVVRLMSRRQARTPPIPPDDEDDDPGPAAA